MYFLMLALTIFGLGLTLLIMVGPGAALISTLLCSGLAGYLLTYGERQNTMRVFVMTLGVLLFNGVLMVGTTFGINDCMEKKMLGFMAGEDINCVAE
jgi:hypothetical protein